MADIGLSNHMGWRVPFVFMGQYPVRPPGGPPVSPRFPCGGRDMDERGQGPDYSLPLSGIRQCLRAARLFCYLARGRAGVQTRKGKKAPG